MINVYEMHNREKKVAKMLAGLPPVANEKEALALSATLAGFTQPQRDCWAKRCGATSPSLTTWDQLVQAVRERRPVSENAIRAAAFARRSA